MLPIADEGGARPGIPGLRCVHSMFEERVRETPDATALTFEGQHLTYDELNRRANRVADLLRERGAGPEVLIGIALERSVELVVTILGVLKSGAAYLPLDPQYPVQRLAMMLDDSRVPLLLTEASVRDKFPAEDGRAVLVLEDLAGELAAASDENPPTTVTSGNLAYVIYTSGSTGKPKGVLIDHYNVTRLFTRTEHWFGFGPSDVWPLFHSAAFDLSVWEMWGALAYGGRLVVVPHLVARSYEDFHALVVRERVTMLTQTPTAFKQFAQAQAQAHAQERGGAELALRFVVFAGEALNIPSLARWFEQHGDRTPRLVNMYGITETTVHVTYREIDRADTENTASVVGTAIPDLTVHVLDERMKPVPDGTVGEIYVGGPGVGRGYLRRPELNRRRFLPDPFSPEPGATLYRSGDLAIPLPGGDLQYVGRSDHQVKVRGHRVELGEIESALLAHEGVKDAVAAVQDQETDFPKVVAYVIPESEAPTLKELRRFLQDRVPDYMLPNAVVPITELPLTASGKLERKALPWPAA
ncbi:amino acid adenylation domain-containing protein [Kitasatospora xanthocidica]|uniref:amino acid adenylation domain-containing protein n=1 Tax=Kitasatospora xanthocidica TaxID=83382 RepID=UPI0036F11982